MKNIHNIMEDQVIEHVNKLYDQVKNSNSSWLTCDCENCRLDTMSYVLNRIQPRYVVSGRGVTHSTNVISENTQIGIDIDTLCIEGMRLVNTAKRPYHKSNRKTNFQNPQEHAEFNFPTFIGNIFDGTTFEPLSNAEVSLTVNGELAEMMDTTWPNPCKTYDATKGAYTFWLAPVEAVNEGMTKKFNFTVNIKCEGYSPATYNFVLPLTSEKLDMTELNSTYNVKIQDIFMFKEDKEGEDQ